MYSHTCIPLCFACQHFHRHRTMRVRIVTNTTRSPEPAPTAARMNTSLLSVVVFDAFSDESEFLVLLELWFVEWAD